jgi:transposase
MDYSSFLGIDVSKEWFDAALKHRSHPKTIKHLQFDNTADGFQQLIKWLKQMGVADLSQLFVCLEHTGVYTIPLCKFFAHHNISYTLVPGVEITNQGISRGKSDKLDAKRIVKYLYKNREDIRIHTLPSEAIRTLKTLLAFRQRIIKAKHGLQVSLKELKSFETTPVVQSIQHESRQIIEQFNQQLKRIDAQIDQCLKENPPLKNTYQLLLSVPGIGRQNALYLIVTTQNFVSFNCPKKYAAYSGIAPFKNRSGKSVNGNTKVSHHANKKMKSLLTSAVVCSLQSCPEYRLYYERQLKKGKNENSIKNVIRNKIVARAFAVIKRNSPYVNVHNFAA